MTNKLSQAKKWINGLFVFLVLCPVVAFAGGIKRSSYIEIEIQDTDYLIDRPFIKVMTGLSLDHLKPVRDYVDTISISKECATVIYEIPITDKAVFVQLVMNDYSVLPQRDFYMLFPRDTLRCKKHGSDITINSNENLLLTYQIEYLHQLNNIRMAKRQTGSLEPLGEYGKLLKELLDSAENSTILKNYSDYKRIFVDNLKSQTHIAQVNFIRSQRYLMTEEKNAAYKVFIDSLRKTFPKSEKIKLQNNSLFLVNSIYRAEEVWCILQELEQAEFFSELIHNIEVNYTSALRDRVLTSAYRNLFDKHSDAANNLIEIKDSFEDELSIKEIDKIIKNKTIGTIAYPFALEDELGTIHKLIDFRGKIIIAHFWFNGCGACSRLTQLLEPIINKYSNRQDIVFLSINVDRNRDRWITGIQSGQYTSPLELNLHVGDLGADDPFLLHYQYKSFPRLLIIDKEGYLISANPPIPSLDKDINEFEELIEQKL